MVEQIYRRVSIIKIIFIYELCAWLDETSPESFADWLVSTGNKSRVVYSEYCRVSIGSQLTAEEGVGWLI